MGHESERATTRITTSVPALYDGVGTNPVRGPPDHHKPGPRPHAALGGSSASGTKREGGSSPTLPPGGWGGSFASGRKREGGLPAYPPSGFRVRSRSRHPARRIFCRDFSTARGFLHRFPFQRRRENPVTGLGGLPDLLHPEKMLVVLPALPSLHLNKMLAARLSQHS